MKLKELVEHTTLSPILRGISGGDKLIKLLYNTVSILPHDLSIRRIDPSKQYFDMYGNGLGNIIIGSKGTAIVMYRNPFYAYVDENGTLNKIPNDDINFNQLLPLIHNTIGNIVTLYEIKRDDGYDTEIEPNMRASKKVGNRISLKSKDIYHKLFGIFKLTKSRMLPILKDRIKDKQTLLNNGNLPNSKQNELRVSISHLERIIKSLESKNISIDNSTFSYVGYILYNAFKLAAMEYHNASDPEDNIEQWNTDGEEPQIYKDYLELLTQKGDIREVSRLLSYIEDAFYRV